MNTAILALTLLAPTAPPPLDVSDTVRNGLKWLADKQEKDGSWGTLNASPRTSITAMAGLAFLMEGSTLKSGTYAPNLRNALAWIEKNAEKNGRLVGVDQFEMYQYMPGHSHAMMFLASVYDVDDDQERLKRIANLMDKAIAFAVECQTSRGGWGYIGPKESGDYDDTQSTATVLQALFAARKAGFAVPQRALDRGVAYLVKATNRDGGVVPSIYGGAVPMGNDGQPISTVSAAAGLLMSDGTRPAVLPAWVKSASATNAQQMRFLRVGNSFAMLHQLMMSRVSFSLGESGHRKLDANARDADLVKWSTYRATLYKALKDIQTKDGNWPDPNYGATYSTAIALVILQLDNEYLPAFAR